EALKLNPEDVSIAANLADAFFKNNQFDSAVVRYQSIISSKQATAGNYNFMGTAYFNLKHYEKAIPVFKKGLKRFPKNEELMLNLGNAYGASGQFDVAKETFLELLAINPNNKQAMQFLSMTYQRLGDGVNAQKYATLATAP
ncbi:MAG: tetratricopeptide repeat protein, partial [Flavobacteriia bacterium]|nr:tetratricopeptide repeat protein [Flavobacteriia bacterium]